jgi:hypothetical protein
MVKMSLEEAQSQILGKVVERVSATREPVVVTGPNGDLAKVIPVPKPVGVFKGRPVYKLEDLEQLDFPYWTEEAPKA